MDCPKINSITPEDDNLVYKKKLEIIEKEACSLYEYCLQKNLTNYQIKECINPFLGKRKSLVYRLITGSFPTLIRLSLLVAVIAVCVKWKPSRDLVSANLKLLSLQSLYIYDWSQFYNDDCVINNPFLPEKEISKKECQGCIDFKAEGSRVDRLKEINDTIITDGYLYYDIPVIVTDPLKNWPTNEEGDVVMSVDKIKELYLTKDVLKSGFEDCEFSTTIDQENLTIHEFFDLFQQNQLPDKFNAAWENCKPDAAKVFRLYAKRPYFLPAMAEVSRANQIVIAKGKFEDEYFTLPQQQDSASWLIVLNGHASISIQPIKECKKFKCETTTFTVRKGEAVVIPTRLWNIEYKPLGPAYTLIFSSTVLWDEV